jgi:hypothetical protein
MMGLRILEEPDRVDRSLTRRVPALRSGPSPLAFRLPAVCIPSNLYSVPDLQAILGDQ